MLSFKPEAAGWEARTLPLSWALPWFWMLPDQWGGKEKRYARRLQNKEPFESFWATKLFHDKRNALWIKLLIRLIAMPKYSNLQTLVGCLHSKQSLVTCSAAGGSAGWASGRWRWWRSGGGRRRASARRWCPWWRGSTASRGRSQRTAPNQSFKLLRSGFGHICFGILRPGDCFNWLPCILPL